MMSWLLAEVREDVKVNGQLVGKRSLSRYVRTWTLSVVISGVPENFWTLTRATTKDSPRLLGQTGNSTK